MKEKSKLKNTILSFLLAVLVLSAVALVVSYIGQTYYPYNGPNPLTFFCYLAAFALVFAFLHDFLARSIELTLKTSVLLVCGLLIMSTIIAHSIWVVVTPNWHFSVSTDKPSYKLGENVKISASLRNMGFITHSFKSEISNPVLISIEYWYYELNPTVTYQVWYSFVDWNSVEFSIGPSQSLDRDFVWNQTKIINIQFGGEEIEPGTYLVIASIPEVGGLLIDDLFHAWTSINITD